MDDVTGENRISAALKRPIVGAVIALIAGLAVFFGLNAWENRPANLDAQFEQAMAGEPSVAPLFEVFKTEFPNDYATFKAEMIGKYKSGVDNSALRLASFSWMRAFSTRHIPEVASAPSTNFREFREAQQNALDGLAAESTAMCGHYAMTGLQPSDRPGPAAALAVGKAAAAQLRAAAAGIKTPTRRAEPSEQDNMLLFNKMAELGMTPSQRAAFTSPGGLNAASVDDQCAIGMLLYRAVGALPEPVGDRIMAALVRSMAA
jgi:hypothetical protein